MLGKARNELICDFAETYHIYELGSLPLNTVAILACGLRDNSRTKLKLTGATVAPDLLLLAHAVDRLSLMLYKDTKDARKGFNRPVSFVDLMLGRSTNQHVKCDAFDTVEDFQKAREKILAEAKKHG